MGGRRRARNDNRRQWFEYFPARSQLLHLHCHSLVISFLIFTVFRLAAFSSGYYNGRVVEAAQEENKASHPSSLSPRAGSIAVAENLQAHHCWSGGHFHRFKVNVWVKRRRQAVGEEGEGGGGCLNENSWREALHDVSTLPRRGAAAAAASIALPVCFFSAPRNTKAPASASSAETLDLQITRLNVKSLQGVSRRGWQWTYRWKSERWIEIN